ncbi:hypothetical protein ACNKFW_01520 [Paracoccus sp. TD-10]|uniref:hypothetical protein n=1 Tax=Paracoccus sp. TD-10 TaxID=3395918 RepID=UPI003AAD5037
MRIEMTGPEGVRVPMIRQALKLPRTAVSYRLPPPHLGEHDGESRAAVGIPGAG